MEEVLKEDLTPAERGLPQHGTSSSFSSDTSVGLGPPKLHSLLSFTPVPQLMALAQPPLLQHRSNALEQGHDYSIASQSQRCLSRFPLS